MTVAAFSSFGYKCEVTLVSQARPSKFHEGSQRFNWERLNQSVEDLYVVGYINGVVDIIVCMHKH